MRRKIKFFGMKTICLLIVMTIVLCFSGQCLAQGPVSKKAKAPPRQEALKAVSQVPAGVKAKPEKKPVPATSFGLAVPQDAAAFFEEARKMAPVDPALAIRLYQRGLMMKPDAWPERKALAVLYEKQGQWNMALEEYEAINKALASDENFANVIRTLGKAGYPRKAAAEARKAFAQYPSRPQFLLQAGELFHEAGEEAAATAALQEYLKLKPDDGQALLLSGSVYEKAARSADALRSYLRAEKIMKNNKEASAAANRLKSGAVFTAGVAIFLPPGWNAETDGLQNIPEGQRVTLTVQKSGDPAALALSAARDALPRDLFTVENRKIYEQSRQLRKEMAQSDPEAAKKMEAIPLPFYSTGDYTAIKGAKIALLSTSESLQPGMESAVAVAVPRSGKTYIFLWRAARPAADGEKLLTLLISQTVWPL